MLEHHPWTQTAILAEELRRDARQLCSHAFGNFVIQRILEHGSPPEKSQFARVVEEDAIFLAMHKVGHRVVRHALKHCSEMDRERIAVALSSDAKVFKQLTRHPVGSFIVRELRRGGTRVPRGPVLALDKADP